MKVADEFKYRKALKLALIMLFCIGFVVSVPLWWQYNRVNEHCLRHLFISGVWGDGGPGIRSYIQRLTKEPHYRSVLLYVYTEHSIGCAPLDEEKSWRLAHKMSEEYGWADADLLLAFKYGYGGFVDGKFGYTYSKLPHWAYAEKDQFLKIHDNFGNGKELDSSRSFALLKKAAEAGDVSAQLIISHVYYTGYWGKAASLSVGVNYRESTKWLEKALMPDDKTSGVPNLYAGHRYRYAENYGLHPDYQKAYQYYIAAASGDQQVFDAMLELAIMYREGIGVEASVEQAMMWLDKGQEVLDEVSRQMDNRLFHWEASEAERVLEVLKRKRERFNEERQILEDLFYSTLERRNNGKG